MEKEKKEPKQKRVKKIPPTEYDSSIEIFLRKNRMFSKVKKIPTPEIDMNSYINNTLLNANINDDINYFIIQLGILENAIERFLYTNDTYVLIIKDETLFNSLHLKDYSVYNNLKIYFFDQKNGITSNLDHIIKEKNIENLI